MLYIVRISQRLHNPILFAAAIWLCLSGSWKIALLAAAAAYFSTWIVLAASLVPVILIALYVLTHVKNLYPWQHLAMIACSSGYILTVASVWGYCVFKFIVVPANFSIPAVLMGYVIATKAWVILSIENHENQAMMTELNMPCLAVFSQIAFISSLVSILMLDKIEGPILLSYLFPGVAALVVLLMRPSREEKTEIEYITDAEEFVKKFRR